MSSVYERLVVILTAVVVALSISGGEPLVALAAVAGVAIAAVLIARHSTDALRSRELTVGARARQHRESLAWMPAPQHPNTAGRPRPRAPSPSMTGA